MFYPVDSLRRGGRFYLCWVADSWPLRFATITHRQLWSQDIRQICNDLLEVMKNESGRPSNRFSLRLSSQLLRGLVRLYHRKVTVFVGDLCMINARVMKFTHKKFVQDTTEHVTRSESLRLVLEMHPDEEAVEERIQNSGNIVANIEDITLKEPTLPEARILLDDGFGELNPDQPLQMFAKRSLETMMFPENPAQHSALDHLADFSTDKSTDKSRLVLEAQMEKLPEHDLSLFGRSAIAEAMVTGDFEKEIPEIPELPHPDPHTDKVDHGQDKETEIDDNIKSSKPNETEDILLEELEEPRAKRRKLKNKLMIDKKIKLSSDYIRSRIDNIYVEIRCEKDIVNPMSTGQVLLTSSTRKLGRILTELYKRETERVQEVVLHSEHYHMGTTLQNIKVTKEMEVAPHVETEVLIQEPDISLLPTQITTLVTSPAEKRVSGEQRSPKRRRSGYVTFRKHELPTEVPTAEETIVMPAVVQEKRLTALLQREGLNDSQEAGDAKTSDRSETPLGSLDRTKVSLGESEVTTDSKRLIREEWGTQGTMYKIYKCIRSGVKPLTIDRVISSGPVISGYRRVITARCFNSILKLKQHGFINIHKDSITNEIKDMSLGSTMTRN